MGFLAVLDRLWLPTALLVAAVILFLVGEREAGLILIGGSGTAALPTKPVSAIKDRTAAPTEAAVARAEALLIKAGRL